MDALCNRENCLYIAKNTRIIMLLDTVYVLYHDDPLPNHASMIRDRVIKITEGTV